MKRSKKLRLVLMGSSSVLLASCNKPTTDALVYSSVEQCANDGVVSEQVCQHQYNQAWQQHLKSAPRYQFKDDCEQDFDTTCQQLSSGEYIPTMEGFMLSTGKSSNSSHSFNVIPLYLGNGGYYRTGSYDRIGSQYKKGKVTVDKSATVKPSIRTTTLKRGGFGSRASARGSWGG